MHHIQTEQDREQSRKAANDMMRRQMEEARKQAERRTAWKKAHPPCPHCGRRDQMPTWLM